MGALAWLLVRRRLREWVGHVVNARVGLVLFIDPRRRRSVHLSGG